MTDPKPLSAERIDEIVQLRGRGERITHDMQLRNFAITDLLGERRRLLSTIRRDRELIRWLVKQFGLTDQIMFRVNSQNFKEVSRQNATDVLAIVEAGDE